jgi:hypothetical protein
VEDLELADPIALGELAVDGVAGAGACLEEELGDEVVGLALADQVGRLGGVGVGVADPEGDLEVLADVVAGPLVVGVSVGERVRGERVALDLTQDAAGGVAGRGIDQDVLDHEHVDRVRGKAG